MQHLHLDVFFLVAPENTSQILEQAYAIFLDIPKISPLFKRAMVTLKTADGMLQDESPPCRWNVPHLMV